MITTSNNPLINSITNIASRVVFQLKIILIVIFTILLIAVKAISQDSTHIIPAKNICYAEVSGKANEKSINFEHVFHQGNIALSYSVGVAMGNHSMSVPISFHAFTTGKSNHLEIALAVIPYVEKHFYENLPTDLDKQLFIKPTIGYRYQKNNGGFLMKAGVGPQIFMDPPSSRFWNFTPKLIEPSGYLAVGISF